MSNGMPAADCAIVGISCWSEEFLLHSVDFYEYPFDFSCWYFYFLPDFSNIVARISSRIY